MEVRVPAPVDVSVVIPTYNRSDLLRRTLETLAAQSLDRDEYEVVVADDGSSDPTRDVVDEFSSRLQLRYHFQEDRGNRASEARNAGARLARGRVLVFLDTGTLAGPDFLRAHRDANAAASHAVLGYTYGYRPYDEPTAGLAEAVVELPPAEVVDRFAEQESFRDWRHDEFVRVGWDVNRRALPWLLYWSTNISVRRDDYLAVGGFDESFTGWGTEDLELGYRLFRRGLPFACTRDGWAIEAPHERLTESNDADNQRNIQRFLRKHRHPMIEITWAMFMRGRAPIGPDEPSPIESKYQGLLAWQERARDLDVRAEIGRAARGLPADARVAVLGCGGDVPATIPAGSVVVDFDEELLDRAAADGRHTPYHAVGLQTPLPDQSVDLVILTSRLGGLWPVWHGELLAEAQRIGRKQLGPETLDAAGPGDRRAG
jgi:glycosyltransferase involved in cell wall biosynthesis